MALTRRTVWPIKVSARAAHKLKKTTAEGNTIENRGCLFVYYMDVFVYKQTRYLLLGVDNRKLGIPHIYTRDVFEHKWRVGLKLHYC